MDRPILGLGGISVIGRDRFLPQGEDAVFDLYKFAYYAFGDQVCEFGDVVYDMAHVEELLGFKQ